jgi:hypothetical protein
MHSRIIFIFLFWWVGITYGQERFLELTIQPTIDGKRVKAFTVIMDPASDFPLSVDFKRKQGSVFLSSGESHVIWVTKKGCYNIPITVSLTNVPKAMQQDKFVKYTLSIELISIDQPQSGKSIALEFDSRYGRIVEKET